MELMHQPLTGQLGDRLIDLFESSDFHTVNIVVAFAKNSGVLRIKDSLKRFRARGGAVNVYVGVDLGGTSYEALTALLLYTDSLNVIHSEIGQTFHSKIYHFLGGDKGFIIVGSHNLTGGGLWTNFESSVLVSIDNSNECEKRLQEEMVAHIKQLALLKESFMPIESQVDVDKLLRCGYVFKEVSEQVRRTNEIGQAKRQDRLFGNGAPTKLPSVADVKKKNLAEFAMAAVESIFAPSDEKDQTIWFETRSMTGGSRNILDLSMKSLVERGEPRGTPFDLGDSKFMRGAVEFFGLDPSNTALTKKITLNFEGVDYTGNKILFPVGESANGTWRLQIKGVSAAKEKITTALKAKGDGYLVMKVVAFTKVKDDYYSMSVFPGSELENFKAASIILARNGSTKQAKLLGLL